MGSHIPISAPRTNKEEKASVNPLLISYIFHQIIDFAFVLSLTSTMETLCNILKRVLRVVVHVLHGDRRNSQEYFVSIYLCRNKCHEGGGGRCLCLLCCHLEI